MERYAVFKLQERIKAERGFEKLHRKLMINSFYEITKERVRDGVKLGCFNHLEESKTSEKQTKLRFGELLQHQW